MTSTERPAVSRRPPALVWEILSAVYEHDEPLPWLRLVHSEISDRWPSKTVENTIYDLLAFGALHRTGQAGTRTKPDTRTLRPTGLGRAWIDRHLLPHPGEPADT